MPAWAARFPQAIGPRRTHLSWVHGPQFLERTVQFEQRPAIHPDPWHILVQRNMDNVASALFGILARKRSTRIERMACAAEG
jgi:hypothetical protein